MKVGRDGLEQNKTVLVFLNQPEMRVGREQQAKETNTCRSILAQSDLTYAPHARGHSGWNIGGMV
jgi:hypothetical protein